MLPPIALQLYTVRNLLTDQFMPILEKIAEIGYVGVETAFFADKITLKQAAQIFKDLDLKVPAIHSEIPLGDHEKAVLEEAAIFGSQRIVWHGWPQDADYGSVDGIKRLAERYNQGNAVAQTNGYRFGIHNHWWEFEMVEGQYPYQILAAEMDPSIFFEVDTYWVKRAGCDPVAVVTELGSRAPILHIKDGPAVKDQPMLAVGQGRMDFPAILQAAGEHVDWLIIEMDECATDMMTAVEVSYRYLVAQGLGRGKVY